MNLLPYATDNRSEESVIKHYLIAAAPMAQTVWNIVCSKKYCK